MESIVKIFYKLSPTIMEKMVLQFDDAVKEANKKENTRDMLDLAEAIRFVLMIYLKQYMASGKEFVRICNDYLTDNDLDEIRVLNIYNYNKLRLTRRR